MPISKLKGSHINKIILHLKVLDKQKGIIPNGRLWEKNKHLTSAKDTSGLERFGVESYQTFKEQF